MFKLLERTLPHSLSTCLPRFDSVLSLSLSLSSLSLSHLSLSLSLSLWLVGSLVQCYFNKGSQYRQCGSVVYNKNIMFKVNFQDTFCRGLSQAF